MARTLSITSKATFFNRTDVVNSRDAEPKHKNCGCFKGARHPADTGAFTRSHQNSDSVSAAQDLHNRRQIIPAAKDAASLWDDSMTDDFCKACSEALVDSVIYVYKTASSDHQLLLKSLLPSLMRFDR